MLSLVFSLHLLFSEFNFYEILQNMLNFALMVRGNENEIIFSVLLSLQSVELCQSLSLIKFYLENYRSNIIYVVTDCLWSMVLGCRKLEGTWKQSADRVHYKKVYILIFYMW